MTTQLQFIIIIIIIIIIIKTTLTPISSRAILPSNIQSVILHVSHKINAKNSLAICAVYISIRVAVLPAPDFVFLISTRRLLLFYSWFG